MCNQESLFPHEYVQHVLGWFIFFGGVWGLTLESVDGADVFDLPLFIRISVMITLRPLYAKPPIVGKFVNGN